MTMTPGLPAAPAAAPRPMAGDRRARLADRGGERPPAAADFDAALRDHAEPAREAPGDVGTDATPGTGEKAPPATVMEARHPSPDDATGTRMDRQAVPPMLLAPGQSGLQPTLSARTEDRIAQRTTNGPKGPFLPALTDEAPQASLAGMPEGDNATRQLPAAAPLHGRATFRIHLQDYRQSRHFSAPVPFPKTEDKPPPAAFEGGHHKPGAGMISTWPQMAFASPNEETPLHAGDSAALTRRVLSLARELSPPAVTTRQLDIAIAPPLGGTLAVRLALRGDALQVTLRVPEAAMAERLQRDADHLARRLGQADIHGATRVLVNVVVDPNAVTPAGRSEAAHGVLQPFAHQSPVPQGQGQQGQATGHMAGQGMGGHTGTGPGQGGPMQQETSPRRSPVSIEENAEVSGSETRHDHDPVPDRKTPAGHRRLYL